MRKRGDCQEVSAAMLGCEFDEPVHDGQRLIFGGPAGSDPGFCSQNARFIQKGKKYFYVGNRLPSGILGCPQTSRRRCSAESLKT